jgi:hypothetical protein
MNTRINIAAWVFYVIYIRKKTGKGEWKNISFLGSTSYLPSRVVKWAGLNSYNPYWRDQNGDVENYLGNENDMGTPFHEIAQIIENHF